MMKIDTILFDLDNTLLTNSMSTFIPGYFSLLSDYAGSRFSDKQRFMRALMLGTQAMMTREFGPLTNREIFWQDFEARTGESRDDLEPFFDRFYETEFLHLQNACELRPIAVDFIRYCFKQGLKVVIATNPLFPRRAVEHRLQWAGIPVDLFAFDLVTTYDNMHATKPNTQYYEEILERVDATVECAVMVGDDWENDIEPARALGMRTFWVPANGEEPPRPSVTDASGTLEDCYAWLRSIS